MADHYELQITTKAISMLCYPYLAMMNDTVNDYFFVIYQRVRMSDPEASDLVNQLNSGID